METRDDSAHFQQTTEGLSVPHLMCCRTEGTFTIAQRCRGVFTILASSAGLIPNWAWCCCPVKGLFLLGIQDRPRPLAVTHATFYWTRLLITTYSSMVQFEINIKLSAINSKGVNRLIARKEIIATIIMTHDWSKFQAIAPIERTEVVAEVGWKQHGFG